MASKKKMMMFVEERVHIWKCVKPEGDLTT